MRGVGTGRAAVSVVNALPLGIGAALGVDWPARVSASWAPGHRAQREGAIRPQRSSTPLVRATAAAALERFGGAGALRLSVRSTIPERKGLKSSSAVGCAVAQAVAHACGAAPSERSVAALVAEIGRTHGLSATGAFDDALAGLLGAGVVTSNRTDRCLRRFDPGPGLAVVLWIPERRHPPSPDVVRRFRRSPHLARQAADAALDGSWSTAMTLNSRLVERAMGYRYARLHRAAQTAGAAGAGVSGLGPAFAVVVPESRARRLLRALPATGAQRRVVRLFRPSSRRRREGP